MFKWGQDIGIDLGTATVIAYVKGKGIVLREPSVVAVDNNTGEVLAVGKEARRMLGRTPGNIVATRPLRDGVISNYTVTEKMLKYFISHVCGKFVFSPRIMICIPSRVTEVEKKAVIDAASQAGARKVYLIEEPIAAAIGAGIDISKPCGNMVVDIGGGTTDIAVISLGGSVVSESLKVAGDKFDEAIVKYIKRKYNVMIGENADKMCLSEEIIVHGTREIPKTYSLNTCLGELMRDPKAQAVMGPFMQGMSQNQAAVEMAEAQENDESGAVNQEMMAAMMDGMPLRQLLSFVPGITREMLEQMVNALNA